MAHRPVRSHSTGTPVAKDQALTTIRRTPWRPVSALLTVDLATPIASARVGWSMPAVSRAFRKRSLTVHCGTLPTISALLMMTKLRHLAKNVALCSVLDLDVA
jgi:hypothetical protein